MSLITSVTEALILDNMLNISFSFNYYPVCPFKMSWTIINSQVYNQKIRRLVGLPFIVFFCKYYSTKSKLTCRKSRLNYFVFIARLEKTLESVKMEKY